jgi:hypothetical protein
MMQQSRRRQQSTMAAAATAGRVYVGHYVSYVVHVSYVVRGTEFQAHSCTDVPLYVSSKSAWSCSPGCSAVPAALIAEHVQICVEL